MTAARRPNTSTRSITGTHVTGGGGPKVANLLEPVQHVCAAAATSAIFVRASWDVSFTPRNRATICSGRCLRSTRHHGGHPSPSGPHGRVLTGGQEAPSARVPRSTESARSALLSCRAEALSRGWSQSGTDDRDRLEAAAPRAGRPRTPSRSLRIRRSTLSQRCHCLAATVGRSSLPITVVQTQQRWSTPGSPPVQSLRGLWVRVPRGPPHSSWSERCLYTFLSVYDALGPLSVRTSVSHVRRQVADRQLAV
jgi:hypothetical protein